MPARLATLIPSIATGMMIAISSNEARTSISVNARCVTEREDVPLRSESRAATLSIRARERFNFITEPIGLGHDLQRAFVSLPENNFAHAHFIEKSIRR